MIRFKLLAALASAGLLSVACGGQLAGGGGTATPGTPIVVDLIAALSGQNSDLGNWMYNGVKLAIDQANSKGGVNGRQIVLSKFDDQGQPTVATDLARRAQSDKAVMVYGSCLSTVSLAMVTPSALFQFPATHSKAPRMTLFPTSAPPTNCTFAELTVPLIVKAPDAN